MALKDFMKRAYDNASMMVRTLVPKDLMNVEFALPLISNLGRWGEWGHGAVPGPKSCVVKLQDAIKKPWPNARWPPVADAPAA